MRFSRKLLAQEKAFKFLRSSFASSQVAGTYLFVGRRGLGKKEIALLFAQSLVCENKLIFSECDCNTCRRIEKEIYPDVKWYGVDDNERSIKIDNIRSLQSEVMLRPLEGAKKVFIINKAERFTEEAANAFLKTLEEPPADTHIVLLVEDVFKLPATIVSRVVKLNLEPLAFDVLVDVIVEDLGISKNDAQFLAHLSQGSPGIAKEYYENDFCSFKNCLIDSIGDDKGCEFFLGVAKDGAEHIDKNLYITSVFMHDVLLAKSGVATELLVNQDRISAVMGYSRKMSMESIAQVLEVCEESRQAITKNANTKLLMARFASQWDFLTDGR